MANFKPITAAAASRGFLAAARLSCRLELSVLLAQLFLALFPNLLNPFYLSPSFVPIFLLISTNAALRANPSCRRHH